MTAFCEHTKFDPDVEQWSGAGGLIMLRILQQRPQIEEGRGGVWTLHLTPFTFPVTDFAEHISYRALYT